MIASENKNKRVACANCWVLTSGVPNQMSLTWSQMAFAADIALDSFRALMTAAPRCCTVWVGPGKDSRVIWSGEQNCHQFQADLGVKGCHYSLMCPLQIMQLPNVDHTNLFQLSGPVFLKKENTQNYIKLHKVYHTSYKERILCINIPRCTISIFPLQQVINLDCHTTHLIRMDLDWLSMTPKKVCIYQSNQERPVLLETLLPPTSWLERHSDQ